MNAPILTEAATDAIAQAVIDVGCAVVTGSLTGRWDDLGTAEVRQVHVLHGAIGLRAGAVDELQYYGGER